LAFGHTHGSNEIESYFENTPKTLDNFYKNILLRKGIERDLEIVGEALNRILKVEKDIQISNARKIVDTRNKIIHGYDEVAEEVIWSIVIKHLPILKEEVKAILED
jgi:uncharacterized protein with HEPN domain